MFKKYRAKRKLKRQDKKQIKNVQSEFKHVTDEYIKQQKAIRDLKSTMTKKEFVKLANKNGYDTHYSGKFKRFFVNVFETFRADVEFDVLIKEEELLSMYYK